jgi:TrmH family RNA methyltransferase
VRRFREVAEGSVSDAMLLDGEHLIEEALASGLAIEVAAFSERLATSNLAHQLAASATKTVIVTNPVINVISPVHSPSGAVGIATRPRSSSERAFAKSPQLVLMLHDLQDPGNVGAIVRAAEACGATGIVCGQRTADPFGWKALRGSMGSAFRLPIATRQLLDEALATAREHGLRILATVARGGTTLPDCDLSKPAAILLGGEGGGLPATLIEQADERLSIPMQAPVESLNVSVAAALVVYEATRQRLLNRTHVAV